MGVVVEVLRISAHAQIPRAMTQEAAGFDLAACYEPGQGHTLEPGARVLVPTGLGVAIPAGHEGQVRPRSGLALRHGVTVLNAPGTIDADYRGELQVLLVNLGQEPYRIVHGERVAQLVIAPVVAASFVEVEVLASMGEGGRDPRGFGTTGM